MKIFACLPLDKAAKILTYNYVLLTQSLLILQILLAIIIFFSCILLCMINMAYFSLLEKQQSLLRIYYCNGDNI